MNIARYYRYGNNVSTRPWTRWWLWTASGAVAYLRPATWPVNMAATELSTCSLHTVRLMGGES